VSQAFTGTIGLPTYSNKGYREYRTAELQIGATTVNVGQGGTGSGSGRLKLNTGTAASTINVYGTGQPADLGNPSFIWHGTNSGNVVNLTRANMGVAFFPGDTATVATLRTGYVANQNGDVQLVCGSGCTLTTIVMDGGTAAINSGATTITNYAGVLTVWAGAITTLNVYGTVYFNTTGTLGTLNLYGTFDTSQDQQAKTITNTVAAYQGSVLNDPYKVIGSLVVKCNGFDDLSNLGLGENVTLSRS
jgi:trimeric autotransporter adhesin